MRHEFFVFFGSFFSKITKYNDRVKNKGFFSRIDPGFGFEKNEIFKISPKFFVRI